MSQHQYLLDRPVAGHRGRSRPTRPAVWFCTSLFLLAIGLPLARNGCGGAAPDRPWQTLFDGKSLQGWEGNKKLFRVQDGAIIGGTLQEPVPQNEFLATGATYGDFELELEVKAIGEGVNGGIQFRSKRIPDHHEMIGYQADVGTGWWGKLYDESRRRKVLAEPDKSVDMARVVNNGQWNHYRIRCQGPHIELWLNGTKTVDYVEPDDQIARDGLVAVQIHAGAPSEVWYRHIRVRELPDKCQ